MSSQKVERFVELEAWLERAGIPQAELARRVSASKSALHRLVSGQVKRIDTVMQSRIIRETEGVVGADAFAAFAGRLAEAA